MNESKDQQTRIEIMLVNLLKSANNIYWIGGYAYGRTSNNDPFLILYPAGDRLKKKACRVYPQDFKKLPDYVNTNVPEGAQDANPTRPEAEKAGIYTPCQLFQIVTYDGVDTNIGKPERRFGDVLRISNQPAPAASAPAAPAGKTRQQRQSRQPKPRQAPAAPPPPPAADDDPELPDYRQLALDAKTAAAFDYGAYMTLKNGLYTEQSRITAIRELIAENWKPGEATNAAMLEALTTYRDKREATMKRGDTATEAHNFALIEARNRYNRLTRK